MTRNEKLNTKAPGPRLVRYNSESFKKILRNRKVVHESFQALKEQAELGGKQLISRDDPKYPIIVGRKLRMAFAMTLCFGAQTGLLFAYNALAATLIGFQLTAQQVFSLSVFLPLLLAPFTPLIVKLLYRLKPVDMDNPADEGQARMVEMYKEVFPKSGLKNMPPLHEAPMEAPNAFATGIGDGFSLIAYTQGLLKVPMTKDELAQVFAHELGHVKERHVLIQALLGSFTTVAMLPVTALVETGKKVALAFLDGLRLLPKDGFLRKVLVFGVGSVVARVLYFVPTKITEVVRGQLSQAAEHQADAHAALTTGKPCLLSSGLQKLVLSVLNSRDKMSITDQHLMEAFGSMMIVEPFASPRSQAGGFKRWWKGLTRSHPYLIDRHNAASEMNGPDGVCPVIDQDVLDNY
jgi:heat shock protein HtpX